MEATEVSTEIHSWNLLRRTEENHEKSVVAADFWVGDLIPGRSKSEICLCFEMMRGGNL
jgi:hypothetical protein